MKPYTLDVAVEECQAAMQAQDWAAVAHLGAAVDRLDTPPQPVPVLAAALWYAEQGIPVFPVQAGSKVPYPRTRGCKDASTDPAQVHAWWEQWPDANVGLATGHLYDVVDIDGLPGQTTRAQHWDMFASLPVQATVLTPRPGGMHLYVPATGQGNKAGVYPGIDYRGVGGYVLAPPSRTPQGTYRFLRPLGAPAAP